MAFLDETHILYIRIWPWDVWSSILSDVNGFLMYDNRENALYAGEPEEEHDSA